MFKRSDSEEERAEPIVGADTPARPAARQPGQTGGATIGPSIRIRGDLAGEEDLVVRGHVEGTISLPANLLTVGKEGQISATVTARLIEVEGRVEGDLNGQEQVILRRSGNVRGNIVAPRVTIEDGCHFKGSIDMDAKPAQSAGGSFADPKVADLKAAAGSEEPKSTRS